MRTLDELRTLLTAYDAPQFDYDYALRQQIHKRDGGLCLIGVPVGCDYWASECHHVLPRGMGGDKRFNNPLNLMSVCSVCHRVVEMKKWLRIVGFDPDGGLQLEQKGPEGIWRPVPDERISFYRVRGYERARTPGI